MSVFDILWRGRTVELAPDPPATLAAPPAVLPAQASAPAPALEASSAQAQRASEEAAFLASAYIRELGGAQMVAAWQRGAPIWPSSSGSSPRAAINAGLGAPWVYIAVEAIALAVASVPWEVLRQRGNGPWEPAPDHPLQALLDRPNEDWTWDTTARLWALYHLLAGEAYLLKNFAGYDIPKELWPVSPAHMTPIAGRDSYLSHYDYQIGAEKIRQNPGDVVPWITPDPRRPHRGLSRLAVASGIVEIDQRALDWQANSLSRAVVPSGIVSDPNSHANLEKFLVEKKKLEAAHAGASNARGVLYLDGGKNFQSLAMTPVELDLLKTRQLGRDQILSLYGVPGPVVGVYEYATYSNVASAYEQFWGFTVMAYLMRMRGSLNHHLASDWTGERLRVEPMLQDVRPLQQLTPDTARTALTLRQCGVPMSEVSRRLRLGLQPYEGWDRPGSPASSTPSTPSENNASNNDPSKT